MSQDNAHDAAEGQEREGNADFRHGRRGGFSRDGGRECGGRQAPGGNGVIGIIREALGPIEKSLTTADFERISGGLNRIAEALRPLHLKSADEIEDFDARTHLFTALLRAGRLAPGKDEAHEAQRRDMLAAVGEVWLALGDEEKSDAVLEAAGRPERTILPDTKFVIAVASLRSGSTYAAMPAPLTDVNVPPAMFALIWSTPTPSGNLSLYCERG